LYTQILDKLFLDHGICCNFILCNVELMTLALAQRSSRQGVRRWKLCKDTVAPCRFLEWGPLSMADLQIPVSISNYRSVSISIVWNQILHTIIPHAQTHRIQNPSPLHVMFCWFCWFYMFYTFRSHGACPAREKGSWCCAPRPGRFNQ